MSFDNRRTYLCYDVRDLIRDGYIWNTITKEYSPDEFNLSRLDNPPKGVVYIVERDEQTNKIISILEKKKLLPANKIKVEIDFSKVMKNAVTHPISPGSISFSPMVSMIAVPMLAPIGFGGISTGITYITFHILRSETKINYPVTVTQEILDTGILNLDGYPLSVFGIVKGVYIENGEQDQIFGLDFDENDPNKNPEKIGKYSDGAWQGTRRKRIDGATGNDGLFGQTGEPEIKFENVVRNGQKQLFIKIVKDKRKLKFRADNYDASGGKDYPYQLSGVEGIDATDKQIRIDTSDLTLGDKIFVTLNIASDRYVRQNLSHTGKIAQGNTIGIVGFRGAIASDVDAWNYEICSWIVPLLPSGINIYNIDEIDSYYIEDSDYKIPISDFIEIDRQRRENPNLNIESMADQIEGWRLSESISTKYVKKFWGADYRGIFLYDDNASPKVQIIFEVSKIKDQQWFVNYLESLDFTYPTGPKDENGDNTYLPSDLTQKIENHIDLSDDQPGFLFDISEIANSILFDREKIPYYRPFADAIKNMSPYTSENEKSGIGIINLDLLEVVENSSNIELKDVPLRYYDLSFAYFEDSNTRPQKTYSCEDSYAIRAYNYWSESLDGSTLEGGMGAWYDVDYIDNELFEWRPEGGNIESYWRLETPYFCGQFPRGTRIYIEKMFGPSLDNFSWIYTDTQPFTPHNISLDNNDNIDTSILVFNDENVHQGLCYHQLESDLVDVQLQSLKVDKDKSHVKEDYSHDNYLVIGQNRIIGDRINYSNGIPIVDDITRVCEYGDDKQYWFSEILYEDGISNYGLDFNADLPQINIPSYWFFRSLKVEFVWQNAASLSEIDKDMSFYFEGTNSSISNYRISLVPEDSSGRMKLSIKMNYYYGSPLKLYGKFWKQASINKIEGRFTSINYEKNEKRLSLADYKIESGQSAVAYDGTGRILVFYANEETDNIDVSISDTDGERWVIHKNLIRLIKGETATLPFVLKDHIDSNYIHLFYVLNDSFLMYKIIDTSMFIYEDAFINYQVPNSYEVGDYDRSLEDPEREYWGNYTEQGVWIRRSPSYFIEGNAEDPYFQKQMKIRGELYLDNQSVLVSDSQKQQIPRFDFSGQISEMKHAFHGEPYTVILDNEGFLKLFFINENGNLSVKTSNNYYSWIYDIENVVIHKNYIDEELNKGLPTEIHNIQIVRDDYQNDVLSVLYFHNGMLFLRNFFSNLIFPWYDSNGNKHDSQSREHLELSENSDNRPIFLVGRIPDKIKETKLKELNDGINNSQSSLYIQFNYDKDLIENFDEKFSIDEDTQVFAYTTNKGQMRIFYKDSLGNLNGIMVDSYESPTLEVMFRA